LLVDDAIIAARESFASVAAAECSNRLDPAQLGELLVPTTLPLPSFSEEAAADAPDTEIEDVLLAVGYLVAERYAVAVTPDEARCLGRLVANSDVLDQADESQAHAWYVTSFLECAITSVPTTVAVPTSG
jgi:hypothetical protein